MHRYPRIVLILQLFPLVECSHHVALHTGTLTYNCATGLIPLVFEHFKDNRNTSNDVLRFHFTGSCWTRKNEEKLLHCLVWIIKNYWECTNTAFMGFSSQHVLNYGPCEFAITILYLWIQSRTNFHQCLLIFNSYYAVEIIGGNLYHIMDRKQMTDFPVWRMFLTNKQPF